MLRKIFFLILFVSFVLCSCMYKSRASSNENSRSTESNVSIMTKVVEISDGYPIADGMDLNQIDVLPTYEIAFEVAYPILSNIYGKSCAKYYPYKAYLCKDSVWIINGSTGNPPVEGGTPYIELSKHDGRVLKVAHGK